MFVSREAFYLVLFSKFPHTFSIQDALGCHVDEAYVRDHVEAFLRKNLCEMRDGPGFSLHFAWCVNATIRDFTFERVITCETCYVCQKKMAGSMICTDSVYGCKCRAYCEQCALKIYLRFGKCPVCRKPRPDFKEWEEENEATAAAWNLDSMDDDEMMVLSTKGFWMSKSSTKVAPINHVHQLSQRNQQLERMRFLGANLDNQMLPSEQWRYVNHRFRENV